MANDTIFTLTSGRSGTRFLSELLHATLSDCRVEHEPYLQRGNPTMFGLPIYDHSTGNLDAVRECVAQKRNAIERYRARCYIETSHAFLKSWWDIAPEFFPRMKVLHLIRHPLEVAKSEANREAFIHRWHLPRRNYRGRDGRRYFFWALTGNEPIFHSHGLTNLTRFQHYLVQWIEIENRAMSFLQRFDMSASCMTLHTPHAFVDSQVVDKLIEFIGLERKPDSAIAPRYRNRTPGRPTGLGNEDLRQCRQIVESIPSGYLEIFHHAPYSLCEWSGLLRKRVGCF